MMKKLTFIFIAMISVLIAASACSGSKSNEEQSKMIVCYYSATGTTEKQAKRIAELTGAKLMEIIPDSIYTEADLDWRDSLSRSSIEMRDSASRPELKNPELDLSEYDVVFIGYPNWWNTCPRIINTFIEAASLNGKTVVPFMTSGGSNITNSENDLKKEYPDIIWKEGLLMNDVSDEQIKAWLKSINE